MSLEQIRDDEFPALRKKTFLDAACVSLAPRSATDAVRRFLEMASDCPAPSSTLQHIEMDSLREAARAGGTANYPGAIALAASVGLINELGTGIIWEHVRGLTDCLMDGLRALDVEVVTPPEQESRSGIVTLSAGDAGRNIALMQQLLDRKILVSVRYTSNVGGVRISCHFFNSQADIDRLLAALAEVLRLG